MQYEAGGTVQAKYLGALREITRLRRLLDQVQAYALHLEVEKTRVEKYLAEKGLAQDHQNLAARAEAVCHG